MNRSKCWWMVVACVSVMGCGDSDADPDAGGTSDADVPAVDASLADGGSGDAGSDGGPIAECDPGCASTEACVRGVCLATCDESVEAFEGALAAGIAPIANLCRDAATAFDVVAGEGGSLTVYELNAETAGTTSTFVLSRWTLSATGDVGSAEMVATTTHEGHAADMFFVGGYLDVSADESGAIFGYTTADAGAVGGVFDVEVGDGEAVELVAPGNYDAAWLDGTRWLLNGTGLGGDTGQSLYVRDTVAGTSRRAVEDLGQASGSVVVMGDLVVAGALNFSETWPDDTMGGRVFVFEAASLDGETISAWDDAAAHFEGTSTFEALGETRIASVTRDDAWAILGIDTRVLREEGGAWTLDEPEALTTGATFGNVLPAGDDHALLEHANGLLFVALE